MELHGYQTGYTSGTDEISKELDFWYNNVFGQKVKVRVSHSSNQHKFQFESLELFFTTGGAQFTV